MKFYWFFAIFYLFSFSNIWNSGLGCSWHMLPLNNVAKSEGNSVGDYSGKKLEQCKDLCTLNPECKSFSFRTDGGQCGLKDKFIDRTTVTKYIRGYDTYYIPAACNGNTIGDL